MVCFGWKGGIGTSSRVVPEHGCTVGVLVLANFGSQSELRVDGVPVGRTLKPEEQAYGKPAGSCIVIVATDAPLAAHSSCGSRGGPGLGLARTGSIAHHGSGEIFLALATTAEGKFADRELDPLFDATVDATEEAVLNALWAAPDTTGRSGHVAYALPHEHVLELLAAAGRL